MAIKRQSKRFKVVLYLNTFSPKRYIRNLKLFLVTINSRYVDVSAVYFRQILLKQQLPETVTSRGSASHTFIFCALQITLAVLLKLSWAVAHFKRLSTHLAPFKRLSTRQSYPVKVSALGLSGVIRRGKGGHLPLGAAFCGCQIEVGKLRVKITKCQMSTDAINYD